MAYNDLEYEYFLDSEKDSENLELDYFTKLDKKKKIYILLNCRQCI